MEQLQNTCITSSLQSATFDTSILVRTEPSNTCPASVVQPESGMGMGMGAINPVSKAPENTEAHSLKGVCPDVLQPSKPSANRACDKVIQCAMQTRRSLAVMRVRCNCGRVLAKASSERRYLEMRRDGQPRGKVLDALGLKSECCRTHFMCFF